MAEKKSIRKFKIKSGTDGTYLENLTKELAIRKIVYYIRVGKDHLEIVTRTELTQGAKDEILRETNLSMVDMTAEANK